MARTVLKVVLAVALLSPAGPGRARAQDAIRGEAKAEPCERCHGKNGVGRFPTVPHLAGLSAVYLMQQMRSFRDTAEGRQMTRYGYARHESVMEHQAANPTDQDVSDLAAFYSGLPCPFPERSPPSEPPRLATRCVSCHGPEGRSENRTVPSIAGQQQRYLLNQLTAIFAPAPDMMEKTTPRWRRHPIMGAQVEVLGPPDMVDLAAYFASRRCR